MDYPVELLPNPTYKAIGSDLNMRLVLRLINTDDRNNLWDTETNQIRLQHICSPEERIDDLSISLLGVYNLSHIYLEFTAKGKATFMVYCAPDIEPEMPVWQHDFIMQPNRHYWWVPISKLHNIPFVFTRSNEPHTAICKVLHTPMLWNFWHFSLRWTTDFGDIENLEPKLRSKVAKRSGHAARVAISRFASIEVSAVDELEKNCLAKANFYPPYPKEINLN